MTTAQNTTPQTNIAPLPTGKVHAFEGAERSLLGQLLKLGTKNKANAAFEQASDLTHADFVNRKHALVFHAMKQLASDATNISFQTVEAELGKALKNKPGRAIDEVTVPYLTELMTGHTGDIAESITFIRKASIKRKARKAVTEMQGVIDNDQLSLPQMMDALMSHTSSIASQVTALDGHSTITLHDAMRDLSRRTIAAQLAYSQGESLPWGVHSGYAALDEITWGFQRKELTLVVARPGGRKSAFAINVALNAMKDRERVLFIPLEMTPDALTMRMAAIESGISSKRIKTGAMTGDEMPRLIEVMSRLQNWDAAKQFHYLPFPYAPTMAQIASKLKQHMSVHGADLIIFDQLSIEAVSLMKGNAKPEIAMSEAVAMLRGWAQEYNVPVLCLAQLNRAGQERPTLSNLSTSDGMAKTPDIVIALYHDENTDQQFDTQEIEFIFLKHREGAKETVKLGYTPSLTRFFNLNEGR